MILRPYQQLAKDHLREALRFHKRVLLVLPTGGGKGVLLSSIIQSAYAKEKRVLFAGHRGEILDQLSRHLDTLAVPHSRTLDPSYAVQVASVQTLARRMDRLPPADLFLPDEGHHFGARTWTDLLKAYSGSMTVSATATPYRLDGRGLGDLDGHGFGFEKIVCVARIHELVEQGYLVPPRVFCPPGPSLRGVKLIGGDYSMRDASAIMDRPAVIGDAVAHWKKLAFGRPTLVFTTSLKHSADVVAAFRAEGISAESADAGTKDRAGVVNRFSDGTTLVLVSVNLYTEGTDLPLTSCISMLRPTTSPSLNRQMLGRGLRTYLGKVDCVVLDHVGNVPKHGDPLDPEEYTLLGRERRSKEPVPSVTVCGKCFAVYSSKLEACPCCGEAKKHKPRAAIKTVDGELVEAGKLALAQWGRHVSQDERVAFLAEKMKVARERGYKPKWGPVQFSLRYGAWPTRTEELMAKEKIYEF